MEARIITLTLEKAKEFYKKGGEFKDLALSAYTEEELLEIMLPKTWEEFCNNYTVQKGECFIDSNSSSVSEPGFCSMASGMAILPISCNIAAFSMTLICCCE